jgi:PAT family beta-lactamase induction signal transducer AmpG
MSQPSAISVYLSRRMLVLLGLGFASGLPAKLLGETLDLWLGELGHSKGTIGLFGLIGLPIAFNFVWAPLMDRYLPPIPGFGRRRGWLLVWQTALIGGLTAMAIAGPRDAASSLWTFAAVGLAVAFISASLDVVSDAYRTDVLDAPQRGAGAAVFVNGYRVAMIAAGGGAALLAGTALGWRGAYATMAVLMGVGLIATWCAEDPPRDDASAPTTLAQAVIEPIRAFFTRRGWAGLAVLAFVVLFKLPDQMAAKMINPLLQQDLGFAKETIAVVREWLGLGFAILGAFAGGAITVRVSMIRALLLFGVAQALSNLGFVVLASLPPSVGLMAGVVAVENFCAGLVTAGFVAFLMAQCDRRYTATQYALFTSLMFGAGRVIGAPTGYLMEAMGAVSFFLLTVAMAAPGLAMLALLRGGAYDGRDEDLDLSREAGRESPAGPVEDR